MKISTKRMAVTAMMAALTVASSALRIKFPVSVGVSSFHLGNVVCALSGILLGPWLGGAAAGIGSAIYDLFDPIYATDAWITFLTKFVYGLAAGAVMRLKKPSETYEKSLLATVAGAVSYAVLYLLKTVFYTNMLVKKLEFAPALALFGEKLPATIFNVGVAVIIAPLLAVSVIKALHRSGLTLE